MHPTRPPGGMNGWGGPKKMDEITRYPIMKVCFYIIFSLKYDLYGRENHFYAYYCGLI